MFFLQRVEILTLKWDPNPKQKPPSVVEFNPNSWNWHLILGCPLSILECLASSPSSTFNSSFLLTRSSGSHG